MSNVLRDAEVSSNIIPSVADLIREVVTEGTEGRARPVGAQRQGYGDGDSINVIPSETAGVCKDVLVAFCLGGDSFNNRLREVAYHAGIHCPKTKVVIFVTSQWNPKDWKKNHEQAFEDLQANVVIYFAGFEKLTQIL